MTARYLGRPDLARSRDHRASAAGFDGYLAPATLARR